MKGNVIEFPRRSYNGNERETISNNRYEFFEKICSEDPELAQKMIHEEINPTVKHGLKIIFITTTKKDHN